MGQDYLTGNGADFAMVFKLENICGTDVGSKANDGGASRWCSFPHDGGFFPTAVRVGLIFEPGLYMLCTRKLRYRKPRLFNAFEIFDHTGWIWESLKEKQRSLSAAAAESA
jgi:hypothetical protein